MTIFMYSKNFISQNANANKSSVSILIPKFCSISIYIKLCKTYSLKSILKGCKAKTTRIWANAQRDGRPAEYMWRPLFNAAKFRWRPLLECHAVTLYAAKTRNPMKCTGVPQTRQQISAVSGPKFNILWGHVEEMLLFNQFFRIVDICLICEDIARQICAMVLRWRILGPAFPASRVKHVSDLHSKFASGPHTICVEVL